MDGVAVDMSELGAFLQSEIADRGWTLRRAAQEIGISKTALNNILKKENVMPLPETLAKLARALSVPVWRLVEMCGVNLQLPASIDSRMDALIEEHGSAKVRALIAEMREELDQDSSLIDSLSDFLAGWRARRRRQ